MNTASLYRNDTPARAAHAAAVARQLDLLSQAVAELTREGHAILAAGVGPGKPFAVLAPSTRIADLADEGRAAYWMRGIDADGQHYRKGQLLAYRNVLVTWTERGN